MYRIFQNFIDCLCASADVSELKAGMAAAAAALDLNCFAYLSMPSQSNRTPQHITTYPPKWTAHYLHNNYERLDPVIAKALNNPEPFDWGLDSKSTRLSKSQQQLFDEAASFGLCCGFTVPIHDGRGPIAAVTFAVDERHAASFCRRVVEHKRVLQLMAMYFHAHARSKLACDGTVDGVSLSPREFECLKWASQGKSAWEIGRILAISPHTVATYLKNAKTKLGVRTIVQAVALLTASKSDVQQLR